MRILDVMHDVKTVSPGVIIKEAAEMMSKEKIGCLIVISGGKIAGIVTERDIMKNVEKLKEKVDKIMTLNVITIEEDLPIEDAAELMGENKIKRLPVVKDGKLIGIITATDILAHTEDLNENFLLDQFV